MNGTVDRLIVSGGNDFQPISADTIAQMSPYRVTRQMRGGEYVTTVVDQDAQIGGDMPTRFLLSESEELVASDGHHITLCPGALLGVMKTGRIVDGLMLSGKKVRDAYPSHWLNSPQWLRFRAEAMERGEAVFEGIRRLRVRCGSTAVNNERPIFYQRQGFGGGAFFTREPFVEAQLADDYLLLDDGIPVERYTAEFYKRRPFVGVRPERIRPGEVFDLTIVICDPESFDNLLITRDDGLRTPEVRVKVNDVDITPMLAEKFAGFNPFGFPSNATSPYPGFRLVWPQMRIDEEMPLQIAVEVRDVLSNVNQTVKQYTISKLDGLLDFFDFPRGLYGVPASRLSIVKSHRFNLVLTDNYTAACCSGCKDLEVIADQDPMLGPWLDRAKELGLKTLASWFGLGEMACFACPWEERILRCFDPTLSYPADPSKIDIVQVVDEPIPIRTSKQLNRGAFGCTYEEPSQVPPGQLPRFPCWPDETWPLGTPPYLRLSDYYVWYERSGSQSPQTFFGTVHRTRDICRFLNQTELAPGQGFRPLFMNLSPDSYIDYGSRERKEIWAKFMRYVDIFSLDYYPVKWSGPLTSIAQYLDEMHEAREDVWAAGATAEEPWAAGWQRCGLPLLWFVVDFGDWWRWGFGYENDPHPGWSWRNELARSGRRCPSGEEYKAMTYLAIVHGAKGLLYHRYPENDCSEFSPYRSPTRKPPDEPPRDPDTGEQACFYNSPNCTEQWRVAWETNRELEILSPVIFTERCLEQSIPRDVRVAELRIIPLRIDEGGPVYQMGPSRASYPKDGGFPGPVPSPEPDHHDDDDPYGFAIHFTGRTKGKMVLKDTGDQFYYLVAVNGRSYPFRGTFTFNTRAPGFHKEQGTPSFEVDPYYVVVMFEDPPNDKILMGFPSEDQFMFACDFSGYQRRVFKIPKQRFPSARIAPLLEPGPLVLERLTHVS